MPKPEKNNTNYKYKSRILLIIKIKTNRYNNNNNNNNNNCDNKCSIYWVAGCCSGTLKLSIQSLRISLANAMLYPITIS